MTTARQWLPAVLALCALSGAIRARAQEPGVAALLPKEMSWPAAEPGQPQILVLEGDPAKPGPFTMRMRVPKGFKFAPHWHDTAERATVLSGAVYFSLGDSLDAATAKLLGPGSFLLVPAGVHHGGWAKTAAVIQIHGTGPFERHAVEPAKRL